MSEMIVSNREPLDRIYVLRKNEQPLVKWDSDSFWCFLELPFTSFIASSSPPPAIAATFHWIIGIFGEAATSAIFLPQEPCCLNLFLIHPLNDTLGLGQGRPLLIL